MRLALATVNFGSVLCENTRDSFMAAADRWGASYVEITPENSDPSAHPFWVKLRLFEFTDADRVFYLDGADSLIRHDAPSPFEVCPPSMLGVVRNSHDAFPDYVQTVMREDEDWAAINEALARSVPMRIPYFNAGMLVLTRSEHARLLSAAHKLGTELAGRLTWHDQPVLNYMAQELSVPLLLMDRTWNYMHPQRIGQWRWMQYYVYHFAGRPERHSVLPLLPWRRSAPPPLSAPWLRALPRRVPVLGHALRYLYWWATLPWKANRILDRSRLLHDRLAAIDRRLECLECMARASRQTRPPQGDPPR